MKTMTTITAAAAAEATTTSPPQPFFRHQHADAAAAQELLAELHQCHGRTVLGLCRLLLRDPAEAEDAAQQTFLSAYCSLLAGNEPGHPAAWLATIARNECRGRVQQRMRQPVPEQLPEELASTLPQPFEAAMRRGELSVLFSAISALPRRQRDALLLREFSGLSYAELADALAVSEPAVESLLVRARRGLRARSGRFFAATSTPMLLLRDWLSRLGDGGESSLGAVAKLGSVTFAAKVAAGAATLTVVGGTVVADGRELARPSAAAERPPARQQVVSVSATSGARARALVEPRVDHHGRHGDRSSEGDSDTRGPDRHGGESDDAGGPSSGPGGGTSRGGGSHGGESSGPGSGRAPEEDQPVVDAVASSSGPGPGDGGQAPALDDGSSGSGPGGAVAPDTSGSVGDNGSGGSSGPGGGTDSGGESGSSGGGSSGSDELSDGGSSGPH
jgi:RNA polymerase sigma factor (sigma-70 family)